MTKKKGNSTIISADVNELTSKLEKSNGSIHGPRLEIIKAKITKESMLDVNYDEHISDDTINAVSKECDNLIHDDLRNAFADLKIHLALICDLREGVKMNPDNYDIEHLSNIDVTGFTIGGDGEQSGVTLIGKKRIGQKVLNLVAPFVKYEDEHDPYKYADDLSSLVEICKEEVLLYLDGKCAAKQPQIDFDNAQEEEEK